MKRILILITLIVVYTQIAFSQKTGNFTDSVMFNGQYRILACHVPADYQAETQYRLMICLHGMGDNSENYRNALINALKWNHVFPATIFICPSGGDDNGSDFSTPDGDEEIIQQSIEYAKQYYSIDTTNIILQGFSLGGRSALKYGLDNPTKFKGLLLNTPAVQGLADALNKLPNGIYYNYAQASKIPIYIFCGEKDFTYATTIPPMYNQLVLNDAKVKYVVYPNMEHSIPNDSATIAACIPFFENPTTSDYDLEIYAFDMEDPYCDTTIQAAVIVRSLGSNTVNSIEINYQINDQQASYTWTGNMEPYQHKIISFPISAVAKGENTLKVNVGQINTSYQDTLVDNNELSIVFDVETQGYPFPIYEGFEDDSPNNWYFDGVETLFTWYRDSEVSRDGTYSIGNFNTILFFYTQGDITSFYSSCIDLTSISNPKMAFDYAYNYHKYTPPYFTADVVFADTLEIAVSFDCGDTYEMLFRKGGADLATTPNPIMNPLSIMECFFIPNDNEWKTEVIDLTSYANQEQAIFKFSYISGMGGCINIDNINFAADANINDVVSEDKVILYPNPARNQINIKNNTPMDYVVVYDLVGKKILTVSIQSEQGILDISALQKGVYFLQIQTKQGIIHKKFTKE
ncbi:MAG: T9SS type A sorting domain-containing protein [Bacteroidales bacterium]|jgi:predicted esterase|nr:T9SS type A sorting domain-containing protein [Bacteroidales bacterium]MDD2687239.1 T9SS type A sorting domain-containing protein [Bacteroidales bacterium]MDD3331282.1 T9SS type A sorting domain-containing protein [Bacteroidales bacterium]MDD3690900.1 T9SS type A sorting domain-containing protein [Bacteroidales bacterium]MDD4044385.1 T9SS type A sorting domain-containing protein [Bacteroidales bacterium]